MAALGEKLKREREARGVSLREIAVATRIHENYLRALEENDYGALPGGVFVTGFLRNYSAHLGLDADKIVAEFEAMKIESPVTSSVLPDVADKKSSYSNLWVVGSLLLMLVAYVAYVNWPGSAPESHGPEIDITDEVVITVATDQIDQIEPTAEKEAMTAEKEAVISDAEKAVQPPEAQPPVAQPSVKEAKIPDVEIKEEPIPDAEIKKEPPPEAAPKKKAVPQQEAVATKKKEYKYWLVVTAHDEDAWILVVVDDENVRDMFVRAGQTIVFKGNDNFNFTTGNASQTSLTLNSKPLNFEIPKNNVIRNWNIPLPETE